VGGGAGVRSVGVANGVEVPFWPTPLGVAEDEGVAVAPLHATAKKKMAAGNQRMILAYFNLEGLLNDCSGVLGSI
jgi:hypothetical protein